MRKALPILAAILCGFLTLVDFFVPQVAIDRWGAMLMEGVIILGGFALWLGLLNLLGVHGQRVFVGERDRGFSLALILALVATLTVGIVWPETGAISWIFHYLYHPLQSTMAALLAFFVVSAIYRAFRLRHAGAAILLVSSLVMLFTQLPFSAAILPQLPALRDWMLAVPVTAGVRGIILGVALGTVSTSLRVLLAVDRPYAGD